MIDAAVETLFRRFRSHSDASALAAVFDRVAPELARVAGYLARGDAQLAADLLQATWLGAIERAASWDDGRPLLPWLLGILANQARSQRRALDRLRTGPDAEALAALLASDDPLRASADGEFARCLAAAMAGLAPPFREVVLLHVQHGLTAKDIGAALGRPAGTVRTQIVRGLDRLRTLLPAGLATAGAVTVGLSAAEMAQLRQQVLAAAPPPAVASASPSGVAAGVALAVVAVVAVGWLWGREEPTVPTPDPAPLVTAAAPTSAAAPEPGERMAVVAPAAVAPPATQPRRRLTVHVRRDEAPAVEPGELVALVSSEGHERLAPTNAAGDAVFDDVAPAGLWWIHLNGAAATATASTGRLPPRDTFDLEVELPVRDGRPLRVRVVDAAGLPVADAEVQGNALEGQLRYNKWLPLGRTAADGVLRLRNQRLARYRARAAGHAPAGESVPRATDGEPEVVLQVGAPAGPLRGQVLDVDGAPIAAELGMLPCGELLPQPWFDHTRPDGTFACDWLGAGHVAIVARVRDGQGARLAVGRADLPRAEPLVLRLLPAAVLSVSTAFADGREAPGLQVRARLLADGCFELPFCKLGYFSGNVAHGTFGGLLPGRWRVEVDFGMSRVERVVDLGPGDTVAWQAVAPPLQELRLRLLDERGAPLVGWSVRLADADGSPLWGEASTTATGEVQVLRQTVRPYKGFVVPLHERFRVDACEGDRGGLDCDQPAYRSDVLAPGDGRIDLVVPDRVRTTHFVRGRLLTPDGQPVAGVVGARSRRHPWRLDPTASVGADGAFALGPLPPGSIALVVHRPGKPNQPYGRVDVPDDGDRELGDVVLRPERLVRATPAGGVVAPADVVVELVPADGGEVLRCARDATGSFVSETVLPGVYTLRGSGQTHVVGAVPVVVDARDVAVVFPLAPAPTLRLTLALHDEERAQSHWSGRVVVRRGSEVVVQRGVSVAFDGRPPNPLELLVAVPAGSYTAEVRAGLGTARADCDVGPAGGAATLAR